MPCQCLESDNLLWIFWLIISHRIHVWYKYHQHEANVGKSTSPMDPSVDGSEILHHLGVLQKKQINNGICTISTGFHAGFLSHQEYGVWLILHTAYFDIGSRSCWWRGRVAVAFWSGSAGLCRWTDVWAAQGDGWWVMIGGCWFFSRNRTNWYQKCPYLKGTTFSKASFWVSMLVFGGCNLWCSPKHFFVLGIFLNQIG